MAAPMPSGSSPAPSSAPQAGGQGPGNAPDSSGGAPQSASAQASPMAFLQMIQKGFQGLSPMIQAAGKTLDPEDIQLFMAAQKSSEALIQSLTQGPAEQKQAPGGAAPGSSPSPGGSLPANASPKGGSSPSNYGGA